MIKAREDGSLAEAAKGTLPGTAASSWVQGFRGLGLWGLGV